MPDLTITAPHGMRDLPGYLAAPQASLWGPGPYPGVVVVHDAFGISDDMRQQADWLATAGYVAVIPDLFSRGGVLRCVKSVISQLHARKGTAFVEIETARAWLAARPDCTGATGVIGYCMGGGFALLLAGRPGYAASSVNYGEVPDDVETVLAGACPVVGSFGGRDRGLKGAGDRLEAALVAVDVAHDVKTYPEAGHAFINQFAKSSPLSVLLKVGGFDYVHGAATDAKARILDFFEAHLRHAEPAPVPGEEPKPPVALPLPTIRPAD